MVAEKVELADLDVIARYSLAVRTASVDRAELVAVLESDLAWLRPPQRRPRPLSPTPAEGTRAQGAPPERTGRPDRALTEGVPPVPGALTEGSGRAGRRNADDPPA
jgi:hypothetical protein